MNILRALLGSKHRDFQEKVLLASLEKLSAKGEISRENHEALAIALRQGDEIPEREEILDYQTRTTRSGGILLRYSLELPVPCQTFVKKHTSKTLWKREETLTRQLAQTGSPHILPIQYSDKKETVLATPFIHGHKAADLRINYGEQTLAYRCLDALLDVTKRVKQAPVPVTEEPYELRFKKNVLERIKGGKTKETEKLLYLYKRDIDLEFKKEPLAFLHGDPNLSNFIINGDETYLIDWESARFGHVYSDLFKLMTRFSLTHPEQRELLRKVHDEIKTTTDFEEFEKRYKRCEIHETLFLAAEFKQLERSSAGDVKDNFATAANYYYTKAVKLAIEAGLTELSLGLVEAADTILDGKVKVLLNQDYESASQYSLNNVGFSTLFQNSLPSENVVADISRILRRRQIKRVGRLGIFAGLGLALLAATLPRSATQIKIETPSVETFLEYRGDAFPEKYTHIIPFVKPPWYWNGVCDYGDEKPDVQVPFAQFEHIFRTGELVKNKDGTVIGHGLTGRISLATGIPGHLIKAILINNVCHIRPNSERDQITGLPKGVLDEFEGKERERTLEEKALLSAEYFRYLLDWNKLEVYGAIAQYYCGSERYNAQGTARHNKLPNYTEFWTYSQFLPDDSKNLAINCALIAHDLWSNANSDGFPSLDGMKYWRINGKYIQK